MVVVEKVVVVSIEMLKLVAENIVGGM